MENNAATIAWPKVIGQSLTIIVLVIWSFQLLFSFHPFIFLDSANLLIHETGHMVFRPFGEFIYFLGGSLFQCIVPSFILLYFYYTKQFFAVGFSLFWLGDNIIYVATYMTDATSMTLPLVGGDTHDWNWIFTQLGILKEDQLVGGITFAFGAFCLILSLGLCIYLTYRKIYPKPTPESLKLSS